MRLLGLLLCLIPKKFCIYYTKQKSRNILEHLNLFYTVKDYCDKHF